VLLKQLQAGKFKSQTNNFAKFFRRKPDIASDRLQHQYIRHTSPASTYLKTDGLVIQPFQTVTEDVTYVVGGTKVQCESPLIV